MKVAFALFVSMILASLVQNQAQAETQLKSVYTSLDRKDCMTKEISDDQSPVDYYTGECSGFGGYQVIVSGGDMRYNVSLQKDGKKIPLSKYTSFHDLGSKKLEWLYVKAAGENSKILVKALIHRLTVQTINAQGDTKDVQILLVSKLQGTKSCTVAEVKPASGVNQNERAHRLAERAESLPCLRFE